MLQNRTIIVAVVIFLLIIAGMFIFTSLKKDEIVNEPPPTDTVDVIPGPYDYIDRVDAKHFFIDGEHTLAGDIMLPRMCDLLDWEVTVAESYPEQVTVQFSVLNTETEDCEPATQAQRFKTSFTASEEAVIRAKLNNRDIILNLIPAAEGETPDDFELFLKG